MSARFVFMEGVSATRRTRPATASAASPSSRRSHNGEKQSGSGISSFIADRVEAPPQGKGKDLHQRPQTSQPRRPVWPSSQTSTVVRMKTRPQSSSYKRPMSPTNIVRPKSSANVSRKSKAQSFSGNATFQRSKRSSTGLGNDVGMLRGTSMKALPRRQTSTESIPPPSREQNNPRSRALKRSASASSHTLMSKTRPQTGAAGRVVGGEQQAHLSQRTPASSSLQQDKVQGQQQEGETTKTSYYQKKRPSTASSSVASRATDSMSNSQEYLFQNMFQRDIISKTHRLHSSPTDSFRKISTEVEKRWAWTGGDLNRRASSGKKKKRVNLAEASGQETKRGEGIDCSIPVASTPSVTLENDTEEGNDKHVQKGQSIPNVVPKRIHSMGGLKPKSLTVETLISLQSEAEKNKYHHRTKLERNIAMGIEDPTPYIPPSRLHGRIDSSNTSLSVAQSISSTVQSSSTLAAPAEKETGAAGLSMTTSSGFRISLDGVQVVDSPPKKTASSRSSNSSPTKDKDTAEGWNKPGPPLLPLSRAETIVSSTTRSVDVTTSGSYPPLPRPTTSPQLHVLKQEDQCSASSQYQYRPKTVATLSPMGRAKSTFVNGSMLGDSPHSPLLQRTASTPEANGNKQTSLTPTSFKDAARRIRETQHEVSEQRHKTEIERAQALRLCNRVKKVVAQLKKARTQRESGSKETRMKRVVRIDNVKEDVIRMAKQKRENEMQMVVAAFSTGAGTTDVSQDSAADDDVGSSKKRSNEVKYGATFRRLFQEHDSFHETSRKVVLSSEQEMDAVVDILQDIALEVGVSCREHQAALSTAIPLLRDSFNATKHVLAACAHDAVTLREALCDVADKFVNVDMSYEEKLAKQEVQWKEKIEILSRNHKARVEELEKNLAHAESVVHSTTQSVQCFHDIFRTMKRSGSISTGPIQGKGGRTECFECLKPVLCLFCTAVFPIVSSRCSLYCIRTLYSLSFSLSLSFFLLHSTLQNQAWVPSSLKKNTLGSATHLNCSKKNWKKREIPEQPLPPKLRNNRWSWNFCVPNIPFGVKSKS